MSILLDSLRKSEAQRKIKDAPSIHSAQPYGGTASAPARWPAIAMIGLVAVAITWFGLRQYAATGPEADAATPRETVAAQVDSPADAAQQPPLTDASEADGSQPRTPVERMAQTDEDRAAVPGDAASSEPGELTPADRIAAFTASEDVQAETQEDYEDELPAEDFASDRDAPAERSLDEEAVEELARVRRAEPMRDESEEPAVMSYWQLPQTWRSEMPEFKLTVLVYAENPEDRFVLLNGERFREGDEIEGGVVLEEIRRSGAIFSYRSRQFMVKS